eukprot:gene8062-10922_t
MKSNSVEDELSSVTLPYIPKVSYLDSKQEQQWKYHYMTVDYKFSVNDSDYHLQQVDQKCKNIPIWSFDECRQCLVNKILQKIIRKSSSLISYHTETFRYDMLVAYLVNIYDSFKVINRGITNSNNICVFGRFSPNIMATILILNNHSNSNITYFYTSQMINYISHDDLLFHHQKFLSQNYYFSIIHTSNLLEYKSAIRGCHVIHAHGASFDYEFFLNLAKKGICQDSSLVRSEKIMNIILINEFFQFPSKLIASSDSSYYSMAWDSVGNWYEGKVGFDYPNIGCGIIRQIVGHMNQIASVLVGKIKMISNHNKSKMKDCNNVYQKKKDNYIVITFNDYIFIETAYGLQDALYSIGYKNVILIPNSIRSSYIEIETLLSKNENCNNTILTIIIGTPVENTIRPPYIIFHTENNGYMFSSTSSYKFALSNALGIFVYSKIHKNDILLLISKTKSLQDMIHIIPMYSKNIYNTVVMKDKKFYSKGMTLEYVLNNSNVNSLKNKYDHHLIINQSEQIIEENADICYFVSFSPRRIAIQDHLFEAASYDNKTLSLCNPSLTNEKRNNLQSIPGRDFYALHSKIIVNFHQFDHSVLETHRINNMLALGKCIISERSTEDPELDREYEDVIYFVDHSNDLYEAIKLLLNNPDLCQSLKEKGYQKYLELSKNTKVLSTALDKIWLKIEQDENNYWSNEIISF